MVLLSNNFIFLLCLTPDDQTKEGELMERCALFLQLVSLRVFNSLNLSSVMCIFTGIYEAMYFIYTGNYTVTTDAHYECKKTNIALI